MASEQTSSVTTNRLRQLMRLVQHSIIGYDLTMNRIHFLRPIGGLMAWAAVLMSGCDAPVEQYPPNAVHALVVHHRTDLPTEAAAQEVTQLIDQWFGTPLEPHWPAELLSGQAAKGLVDQDRLLRAPGSFYSDQDNLHYGLYTEHCVRCHGVNGGGNGAASALQNPYPRDFRAGIFKWKSTQRSARPTKDDLRRLMVHGAPGTSMPSFSRLSDDDLEVLVDYVIYLSVRGELERWLLYGAVEEIGYGDEPVEDPFRFGLVSIDNATGDQASEAALYAAEHLQRIVDQWGQSEEVAVPGASSDPASGSSVDADSVARGKELFHGQVANCAGCHGVDGVGGVNIVDYDDWSKEYSTRLGITPTDRQTLEPFEALGALRPRLALPRELAGGYAHGGADAVTLYRRITQGIAGTPMPAVMLSETPSATALTPDQVWDLVHYVQSLLETK